MSGNNQTMDRIIILLGFQMLHDIRIPFFLLVFVLYCLAVTVNIIMSVLVFSSPNLHHPMFFFLSHLSICDLTLTTSIVPAMLPGVLRGTVSLPLSACLTQLQIFGTVLISECFLLSVMSFDRYLAICHPFHYITIMTKQLCYLLVILCWTISFLALLIVVILLSRLEFCLTHIDHFICDYLPVLQLSCSDTFYVKLVQLSIITPLAMFMVLSILVTYVFILKAVFNIPSVSGRQKAFSTCSSHIAVVGTFFGSLIGIYILPSTGNTLTANKVVSLFYSVGTPLFNPIIYCLRNVEIREAFKKSIRRRKHI